MSSVLNPTPREKMVDAQGRPYFLWDVDMTLHQFLELLQKGDRATQVYLTGKLMRQAKPDDVFTFVTLAQIADSWPEIHEDLGRWRPFWEWLLRTWRVVP